MKTIRSLSIGALALCLTACGTPFVDRSPGELVETRKPQISAAVLAEPEGKTEIPRNASLETQWEHLEENRRRLDACVMTANQRALVIEALQER